MLRLLVTSSDNLSSVIKHHLQVTDRYGKQVFNPEFTSRGDTALMLAAGCRKYYTMEVLLDDPAVVCSINHCKLQAAIALPSMVFLVVLTVARKEVISIGGSEYGDKKFMPCNESPQSRVGNWYSDYKAP